MTAFYLLLQDKIKEHNKNCAGTETNHTNLGIYSLITEKKIKSIPPKVRASVRRLNKAKRKRQPKEENLHEIPHNAAS